MTRLIIDERRGHDAMANWAFCTVGVLGLAILGLFLWFVFVRKEKFDAPLLGLLTLSLLLILMALVRPDSIKYGGMEFNTIKQDAKDINSKAKETVQLALETTAMLIWNEGRLGAGGKHNEEIATNLLRELYGDKALQYRYVLQKKGIFLTPKPDLLKIPDAEFPKEVRSPLYEKYLKNLSLADGR
ncbi:MAG: hypothetical protein EPO61_11835 [Nitrospirae bacterium]|nr:MAG: hypothetical protein EPO61_11835 [Nitrospirota bacterium]